LAFEPATAAKASEVATKAPPPIISDSGSTRLRGGGRWGEVLLDRRLGARAGAGVTSGGGDRRRVGLRVGAGVGFHGGVAAACPASVLGGQALHLRDLLAPRRRGWTALGELRR
jgi:hypothetical protein